MVEIVNSTALMPEVISYKFLMNQKLHTIDWKVGLTQKKVAETPLLF